MDKVKVVLGEYYKISNKNYVLEGCNRNIKIYEKGKHCDGDQFLRIETDKIEFFHIKNILNRFGFELVEGYEILGSEREFLNFFKGKNVGIISTEKGYKYIGFLGMTSYSKKYLEETYKVIINF